MKIAVVIKECAYDKGGAERYASRLMWHLADSNHDVHLFSHSWDPMLEKKIQCHFVPYKRKPLFIKARSFAHQVKRQLMKYHFDLILGLTQFVPQDIYRTGGGLYVSYLKTLYPNEKIRKWKSWLPKARYMLYLEKKIIHSKKTYFFMANSHMCRDELIQFYKVDPKKIEVIYNGINQELFHTRQKLRHRKDLRHEHGISPKHVVFLFVGNGFRRKNLDTVLEMAYKMKHDRDLFKFVVIGRGRIGHYRRKATELGVEDLFLFLGPQTNVTEWYHASDALIHPALYDPCSNACLEALACGLPVLTTSKNGASYWINGQNGFVITDPRDATGFAACASQLFDPTIREKMQIAAVNSVSHLTDKNHYEALNAMIEKVALLKKKTEHLKVEPAFYYAKN